MNIGYERKKILVTVKTYPNPSKSYRETVCTAGITDKGEWIRIYPIRFRDLSDENRFELFRWIEIDATKRTSDDRPESFKIDIDTLKLGNKLDSQKDIKKRCDIILPLEKQSMEEIQQLNETNNTSLGLFKPKDIDFSYKSCSGEWSKDDMIKLSQGSFLSGKEINDLKKVPYTFYMTYKCNDEKCKGHKMSEKSYELNWSYFTYLSRYESEEIALLKLKEKWLSFFDDRHHGYLIVGSVRSHKKSFIIIGHFSYLKKYDTAINNSQLSLFNDNNL